MISIDSRIVIRLRRRNTPAVPMANRIAESDQVVVERDSRRYCLLPARQDDGADHRHQNQDRRRFERERVVA